MNKSTTKKGRTTNGNSPGDGFSFGSSHSYGDNSEFASKNLRFEILAIAHEPGRGIDAKDRWAITVKVADREAEVLTLGCNPKRDEELRAAQAHLARGGTITNKRLRLSGSAYYFTDAE
ncbi:MAG TPA: hypothetical protein VKE42_06750 [Candidatus Cybelea sp.]|nr:hypothetical protein [Candidatus Cybelea sp.]